MNTLSWLLYVAEIAGGLKVASVVGLIITSVAGFLLPPKGIEAFSDKHFPFSGLLRRDVAAVGFVFAAIMVLTPSQDTVLKIAASQIGESILATEQAQEIGGEAGALAADSLRVLRKFINEQLAAAE